LSWHRGRSESVSPPDELDRRLDRILATAQAEQRIPSVSAAVFRDGEVLWRSALGSADVARGEEATTDHAFRIGSITKTFTAVCVLQLRDAMVLDLDDPLRTHIPEAPVGLTIRDALAHLSGLQREPPGEIWETMQAPTREELVERTVDAEQPLAPGSWWHYSNLAFALLGEVVARKTGGTWEDALSERVLGPLGLDRTTAAAEEPAARGYFVQPYSDVAQLEPDRRAELMDRCRQLLPAAPFTPDAHAWATRGHAV